jgi:hypothetical protein
MTLSWLSPLSVATADTGSSSLEPQSLPQGAFSYQLPVTVSPADSHAAIVCEALYVKLVTMNGRTDLCV